jgi:branched-chain amino acid transport system ATP-binding protein
MSRSGEFLEVINLSKHFKGLRAVDDVTFSVGNGEFLGIIGPNGAGKTTLFNLITGFLKPTSGEIHFVGRDITGMKPHERVKLGIARTFQVTKPFKKLTVMENVIIAALIARKQGKIKEDEKNFAAEVLEKVGLLHRKDMAAENLPHGEVKKLEIARALATKPELLLLDEPFSGLTGEEVASLQEVIKSIHEDGITVILIEHVLKACMALSERIIVLNYGKIIADGTPEEVCMDKQVIEAYLGRRGLEFASG